MPSTIPWYERKSTDAQIALPFENGERPDACVGAGQ